MPGGLVSASDPLGGTETVANDGVATAAGSAADCGAGPEPPPPHAAPDAARTAHAISLKTHAPGFVRAGARSVSASVRECTSAARQRRTV